MRKVRLAHLLSVALLLAFAAQASAAPRAADADMIRAIDAVMSAVYKPGEPGATLIVRRAGETLVRRAYGLANLELGVKAEPDMIFRLGSVTKQFTAVAILMLAQEGRLSLQDEIGRYIPDFPTAGRRVTVEHLLTHTSGIKSYTNMEEWLQMWRKDMSVAEIIALSKEKPFEFESGAAWNYNNTGYVMLGAVIEKVSGMSYEQFVQTRIFAPLGMAHSGYDHTERVVPRRVPGYQKDSGGWINAPYLSMSQPYAAGSLLSSVDDLAVWNDALQAGKLLKKEWLDKAFTSYRLADGEPTGYGYGWFVSDLRGHRCIEHGGGINGFTSYALSLPDDGVYVAILTNAAAAGRAPEPCALRIAEIVLGLAPAERKPVALSPAELEPLVGVYVNRDNEERTITREGGQLFSQRAGGARYPILAAAANEFFFADTPTRIRFHRDASGAVTGLRVLARIGPAEVWARTAKPLPQARREIALAPEKLTRLAGEYQLMPGFSIVVTVEAGRLMVQPTGQPKFELFAEAENAFFLKVVDARVIFDIDAGGQVTGLTLLQGGQKLPGKKVR